MKKAMLPLWRKNLATYLRQRRYELSAMEIIELYYRFYSNSEIRNYFPYSLTQNELSRLNTLQRTVMAGQPWITSAHDEKSSKQRINVALCLLYLSR